MGSQEPPCFVHLHHVEATLGRGSRGNSFQGSVHADIEVDKGKGQPRTSHCATERALDRTLARQVSLYYDRPHILNWSLVQDDHAVLTRAHSPEPVRPGEQFQRAAHPGESERVNAQTEPKRGQRGTAVPHCKCRNPSVVPESAGGFSLDPIKVATGMSKQLKPLNDSPSNARLARARQPDELDDERVSDHRRFGCIANHQMLSQIACLAWSKTLSIGWSEPISRTRVPGGYCRARTASARRQSVSSDISGFRRQATAGDTHSLMTKSGGNASAARY